MRIHILGVCGTFMAGVALLAKQLGHEVVGSDVNNYPPMNEQLAVANIPLLLGYDVAHLNPAPDLVIVGNVIARGNAAMEYVLQKKIPYISGPQWLFENVLRERTVLAVAGTHGKTTTTSILSWILEVAGLAPGFLVGGIPSNFGVSARLGDGNYFVIEADEYDCAFFDKRSKFLHYHPTVQILNNLEFDHADIFNSLDEIKRQFHYLVRTIPSDGLIVANGLDENIHDVLGRGCWTPVETFGIETSWHAKNITKEGMNFDLYYGEEKLASIEWSVVGRHNLSNAIAAIAAAHRVGVKPAVAAAALKSFKQVKRRLEYKGEVKGVAIYDDFAHHPTAIAATIKALSERIGGRRVIAIVELGSNSMKMGVHHDTLCNAWRDAGVVLLKVPENPSWDVEALIGKSTVPLHICYCKEDVLTLAKEIACPGDTILVMSNTGFNRICEELLVE